MLLSDLKTEKSAFLRRYGDRYGYQGWLDRAWQKEVGYRFGQRLRHYLDFTGAALYTRSHITAANQLLEQHTFSNPHSRNPSSLAAEEQVQAARKQVLDFFNADDDLYTVIWTSGATAALKLVGEAFPWSSPAGWAPPHQTPPGGYSDTEVEPVAACGPINPHTDRRVPHASHFVYLRSNHKSVLGIGAYAKERGARLSCVDEAAMAEWLDRPSPDPRRGRRLMAAVAAGWSRLTAWRGPQQQQQQQEGEGDAGYGEEVEGANWGRRHSGSGRGGRVKVTFSLVAYPSKDNYEGVLYPLDWVKKVHAKSTQCHRWLVVLDAAAHVPTHPLDLSKVHPDFVPVSWYKLFGFPTGLGALIARKDSLSLLHKYYFGGGSVVDATAEDVWRVLMPAPDGYEDGTQSFLGIAQLQFGFAQLQRLGGVAAIEQHVRTLQLWLYQSLSRLTHGNGQPLVTIFGKHHLRDPSKQSCILQLLVHHANGSVVSSAEVERVAVQHSIGLRTGCMCNPSQCIYDLGIRPEEHRAAILNNTDTTSGFLPVWRPASDCSGKLVRVQLPVGSVRASLGYLSTFEDVYAFVHFLQTHFREAGSHHAGRTQHSAVVAV